MSSHESETVLNSECEMCSFQRWPVKPTAQKRSGQDCSPIYAQGRTFQICTKVKALTEDVAEGKLKGQLRLETRFEFPIFCQKSKPRAE